MSQLKDMFSRTVLTEIGEKIANLDPDFSQTVFLEQVYQADWPDLALMARVKRIARALNFSLSHKSFPEVTELLIAIQPEKTSFIYIFIPEYISLYGQDDFTLSLATLAQVTGSSSGEFAIRDFLSSHPQETLAEMTVWAKTSSDEHLRRLASEGCRLLLPWAKRVPVLTEHIPEILVILESLKDDSALYVRKSVANNLNDLTKQYPELILDLMANWLVDATKERQWIIQQGLRTLIKQGHPKALDLLNYGSETDYELLEAKITLDQAGVTLGETTQMNYEIALNLPEATKLRLLLEITFQKKHGTASKRFFVTEKTSSSGHFTLTGTKNYKWVDLTTRTHYPGSHSFSLILNGQVIATTEVELLIN